MYKQIKWAIIGLGNPGIEYSFNRHNIGWLIAQALIDKYYKDKIELITLNNKIYLKTYNLNSSPNIIY
jgi:peptidyl-tRNA hydrolase